MVRGTAGEDGEGLVTQKCIWAGKKGAGRRPLKVPLLPRDGEQLGCEVLWLNQKQIEQEMLHYEEESRNEESRNRAGKEPDTLLF